MAKVINEIKVASGKYTNKSGEEKTSYQRIGSIIETKKGSMIKIDSIPVVDGGWSGWAYIFEPREQQAPKNDGFDDAPF
jgi:hypothetical protein